MHRPVGNSLGRARNTHFVEGKAKTGRLLQWFQANAEAASEALVNRTINIPVLFTAYSHPAIKPATISGLLNFRTLHHAVSPRNVARAISCF